MWKKHIKMLATCIMILIVTSAAIFFFTTHGGSTKATGSSYGEKYPSASEIRDKEVESSTASSKPLNGEGAESIDSSGQEEHVGDAADADSEEDAPIFNSVWYADSGGYSKDNYVCFPLPPHIKVDWQLVAKNANPLIDYNNPPLDVMNIGGTEMDGHSSAYISYEQPIPDGIHIPIHILVGKRGAEFGVPKLLKGVVWYGLERGGDLSSRGAPEFNAGSACAGNPWAVIGASNNYFSFAAPVKELEGITKTPIYLDRALLVLNAGGRKISIRHKETVDTMPIGFLFEGKFLGSYAFVIDTASPCGRSERIYRVVDGDSLAKRVSSDGGDGCSEE